MKRFLVLVLAAALCAPASAQPHGGGGAPLDPTKKSAGGRLVETMRFPPLNWKVPQVGREVERLQLSNGMVVYLLPDPTLPRVQALLSVRGGSLNEPLEKHGMAEITADLMRTGGTEKHTPEELDRVLEIDAISISTGVGDETTGVALDVMKDKVGEGLDLLAEVALRPRFDPKQLEILREQVHEVLRRQNDRPSDIVFREFPYLIYGEHPSGRKVQWPVVKGLTREDLQAWHRGIYTPSRAWLTVAGDFDRTAMVAELERVFGGWTSSGAPLAEPAAVPSDPEPSVYLVEKQINQSNVILGHLGVTREDPDRYAIEVLNYILGGGSFTSRLMESVRNRAGLAYSVSSSFDLGSPDRGLFFASFQTRADATHQALDLVLSEIGRMRTAPVTAAELAGAKQALVNRMVFAFDTPDETVRRLVRLEIEDRPRDYYETYAAGIQAVTAQDLQRVAQRVLRPDRLVVLVVGDPSKFDRPLDDIGPVQKVELQEVD